ncbi:MAG: response regulator [Bacillota bacterium]
MSEKQRVLLIDDERNIRMIVSQCLSLSGFEVVSAVNGYEGLNELDRQPFDLVLLDMMMPGIDGVETLRRIRDLQPLLPVIMITAHGTIENAVESMKLGAVDYLRKPFTPDEIRATCEEVLSRSQVTVDSQSSAGDYLRAAKDAITKRDLSRAHELLSRAIALDAGRPEAYNLMGVLLEIQKRVLEAQRMYRAALAVDPSYRPADENLHRTVQFFYSLNGIKMGDEQGRE